MVPVRIRPEDRPAYHAAASIASNFLITPSSGSRGTRRDRGDPASDARSAGPRDRGELGLAGGALALTGPVARGDGATVARQREAVAERTPALVPLFDALTEATRALASGPSLERA